MRLRSFLQFGERINENLRSCWKILRNLGEHHWNLVGKLLIDQFLRVLFNDDLRPSRRFPNGRSLSPPVPRGFTQRRPDGRRGFLFVGRTHQILRRPYVACVDSSRNPSSLRLRTGCWSLRRALASIWRTRSRVTLNL